MLISDGFPNQRMLVLPRPRVRDYLQNAGSAQLVVTDCGYFPRAKHHGQVRKAPIGQLVVLVCVEGRGWCETRAGRFDVSASEAVILPPGEPHSYGADHDDPWTLWWYHVTGSDVDTFARVAGLSSQKPVRPVRNIYHVVSLMTEVVAWMERDSTTPSLLAAAGAAWHALTLFAAERQGAADSADIIEQAADYIRTNLAEQLTVAELAAMSSLSGSHFGALFKRHIGSPVVQYQTMLRMAKARELLDTTQSPVATIAREVGYPDSFYFARQFKKIHGVPPRDYRNQHKG
ncbi:AraC family transcriptional regulator [Herbiconiux sp. CPCC 205763]|uniref:AraC family transcriptional regulator n=1 Tax=Herbiconiux aconitum TaxID=2970913 RepID=A0ABT2GS62_9MICO|nr:AraC family transcriptional regulator [Herbiconiux aconitum]MCS5719064.1 AraC family transcriptional regulator [Herbiconiux aconitum]